MRALIVPSTPEKYSFCWNKVQTVHQGRARNNSSLLCSESERKWEDLEIGIEPIKIGVDVEEIEECN